MKIPKQYQLMGETIKVYLQKGLSNRRDLIGEAHHRYNEIYIDPAYPISVQESTFYHELVHTILEKMGRRDLNDDEVFVTGFGGLLHQALKSAK